MEEASMSDEKKGVTFEDEMDLEAVQEHLKSLLAGFKAGSIYIQNGGDVVGLHPEPTVTMALEARNKKDKQSLKIEIRWQSAPVAEASKSGMLLISKKEPEPVLVEEEEA
jgi:amphi-Trp domain-containing protein